MIVDSRSVRSPALPVCLAWLLALNLTLVVVVVGLGALIYTAQHGVRYCRSVEPAPLVYFAPDSSPTAAIVHELNDAQRMVHVQAYSFTSVPIAKALVDAEKRGVNVEAILDKSNQTANYSAADFLAHEGVLTFIDAEHAIAHNKIMIIDGRVVITGSFNFTKAAEERNAENLLVIRDRALAEKYERNWQLHLAHSKPYAGR